MQGKDPGVETIEREFLVDGERFLVRLHEDGAFDCTWMTGPVSGYGFASGASTGYTLRSRNAAPLPSAAADPAGRADDEQVTDSIRSFLATIDPETGFITE